MNKRICDTTLSFLSKIKLENFLLFLSQILNKLLLLLDSGHCAHWPEFCSFFLSLYSLDDEEQKEKNSSPIQKITEPRIIDKYKDHQILHIINNENNPKKNDHQMFCVVLHSCLVSEWILYGSTLHVYWMTGWQAYSTYIHAHTHTLGFHFVGVPGFFFSNGTVDFSFEFELNLKPEFT